MKTIKAFVKSRPVVSYFVLAFVISWGDILIVAGGPGGISVNSQPSEMLMPSLVPIATASARILSVTEQTEAQIVTDRQFGWLKKYFALIWRVQGREPIYLEITPKAEE